MHSRCLQNVFIVQKEMVRILLGILDPSGVAARVKRKLKRRHYRSKGPNYIWHLDSYDKLKPYGICVNGCIDGFSRFIIWLRVGRSNNNPRIVAGFYVEALTSLERVPHSIRSDMGTENSYIAEMQSFLRRNGPGSRKAFLYGTSQHNQRIESWWGILIKECVQFWMEFFEQMKQDGYFTGDFIDKSLIQYFFMDIIRRELENVVETWNAHRIRKSKHCDINGRPMVLYQAPFLKGTEDYSLPLENVELNACAEECDFEDSDCQVLERRRRKYMTEEGPPERQTYIYSTIHVDRDNLCLNQHKEALSRPT
ncbi:uncharacterized protein LOC134726364 [Mytilus trossulus]|uniref:uncharacterized protein LOC134726364 n=1 Tax=Mytilus trossulus TaxID=6551 RepID=UPI0030064F7B